jgi:hypothetical protein
MAACDPIRFTGITSDIFQNISRELAGKGFVLSGPNGVVNGPFGIVIEYFWNEQAQTLQIEVLEKNFFVSCNQIREQITGALEKYSLSSE